MHAAVLGSQTVRALSHDPEQQDQGGDEDHEEHLNRIDGNAHA